MKNLLIETTSITYNHSYSIVSRNIMKNLKCKFSYINFNIIDDLLLDESFYKDKDAVLKIRYPYIFDERIKQPQIIFYTNEYGKFIEKNWNISYEKIQEYIKEKRLILITPSQKSNVIENSIVIPHSVDLDVFKKIPKPANYLYKQLELKKYKHVFLNVSAMSSNKNIHLIIKAFYEAKIPDSILILKGNKSIYKIPVFENLPPSIKVLDSNLSDYEMNELYNSADYYISGGVNEGFDLPLLEAHALGIKTIGHVESPSEYIHNSYKTLEELTDLLTNFKRLKYKKKDFISWKKVAKIIEDLV